MRNSPNRELVAALRALPVFAACSSDDLEDLAKNSRRTSVPQDWPLIHQQTPADACYVLLSGGADIRVDGETVATVTAGAVVGEAGLASRKLRNATVTSTTALDLLNIPAEEFQSLIERRPALQTAFLARVREAAADE
jgi:CRP/FNR family transcriptional regulator, cyclic AMP receptor protein